jgi:ubiquinone/menaquinone biosynthesis C-methylase UbiE
VADHWEEQAETFDDAPDHGLRDPATRRAWAALLMPLMPPAPARIADLGCGTGSLAVLLAEAGHDVAGVDLAVGMVQRARTKASIANVSAEFVVGDAGEPPWPTQSFDVVLARHVLWALDDPGRALDRWLELLRPEGRLVLVEGLWWTDAGLPARHVVRLLRDRGQEAEVTQLDDPALWGGPIDDERYLLVSPGRW